MNKALNVEQKRPHQMPRQSTNISKISCSSSMQERNWTSCDECSRGNLDPLMYTSRTRKLWRWMEFRPFLFLIFRSPAIKYTYIPMNETSKTMDTTTFSHILILHSALSSYFVSLKKKYTKEICLRQCASLTLYKFSRWKENRKNYNIYLFSSLS